ncbi:hypothetical protein LCGC14_1208200 [marine sediment metagenome]|uniref:Uncharacterized protein n=1 Tax=marine sediment metagenome TaxID=412755 RepID=A0A0F9LEV3_9ZZZZ
MKAEDTVMSFDQWAKAVAWGGGSEEGMRLAYEQVKLELGVQAEISFKAGQQEVVEFVESSIPKTLANYIGFWQDLQAKKEEWGLK